MGEAVGEPRRLRIGDRVTLTLTVLRLWTDADAARRKGDDGRRADLAMPGGGRLRNVAVAELAPPADR